MHRKRSFRSLWHLRRATYCCYKSRPAAMTARGKYTDKEHAYNIEAGGSTCGLLSYRKLSYRKQVACQLRRQ